MRFILIAFPFALVGAVAAATLRFDVVFDEGQVSADMCAKRGEYCTFDSNCCANMNLKCANLPLGKAEKLDNVILIVEVVFQLGVAETLDNLDNVSDQSAVVAMPLVSTFRHTDFRDQRKMLLIPNPGCGAVWSRGTRVQKCSMRAEEPTNAFTRSQQTGTKDSVQKKKKKYKRSKDFILNLQFDGSCYCSIEIPGTSIQYLNEIRTRKTWYPQMLDRIFDGCLMTGTNSQPESDAKQPPITLRSVPNMVITWFRIASTAWRP
ncbi:hypothetical protein K438DRAFT_1772857 [Mycena galopus ATCC 62051]|nr:hypothetical protein K438DRAFT_1772857 [Mycena galopus ATCC 62051]